MDSFEREVRRKLKSLSSVDKIYLKKNYQYEVFGKHNLSDEEINLIFDPQHLISISPNLSSPDRIDVLVQTQKQRRLKIIIQFDPIIGDKQHQSKVGIITAFFI